MSDKFNNYTTVLNALVSEAISCSPRSWSEGFLTIDCDGSYMNYKLKNEGSSESAKISGELRQLCEELYVVMRKAGDWWLEANIHFFKESENWSFKVNFKYSDNSDNAESFKKTEPSKKKPWWRLW